MRVVSVASGTAERPLLLSPLRLRDVTLKNRVTIAPMATYSAANGLADPFHLVHLGRFALGGAGLVFTEAVAALPEGRITHGCLGLWTDEQARALRPVVDFIHRCGAAAGIKLAHAGRKASAKRPWHGGQPLDGTEPAETAWPTVSASSLPFCETDPAPRALGPEDMDRVADAFVSAALRADATGFDVLELHYAHGYLLHSFLSPLANRRDDAFGGSLPNRMRFPLRVVEAVRRAWPEAKPLFVRLSVVDGIGVGWSLDDTVAFAIEARQRGVDVIDCSSGGMDLSSKDRLVAREPGFHVPMSRRVREASGLPTVAVGLITRARQAEDILASGAADLVAIARGALLDPNWALRAGEELGLADPWLD